MDLLNLASRLRLAGKLETSTPALTAEVIQNLARFAPAYIQRDARNRLWRQATALIPGSRWAKASRLLWELENPDAPASEFRSLVLEGIELSPGLKPPTTLKALLRLVSV